MNLMRRNAFSRGCSAAFAALAIAAIAVPAHADTVNVINPGFEMTTAGTGQLGFNTEVTGWTTAPVSFNIVYTPGTADTTGATSQFGTNIQLWGPGNGSANGLGPSPNGGNYVAMDGGFNPGTISQTLNGLIVGDSVTVSFDYAGAQQSTRTGPTTEQLVVGLGGQTQSTPILMNASEGFTGWQTDSFTFTATSTSEVLSFLAVGTPAGVPPFTLLDGISVTQTPEPQSLVLFATGLIGVSGLVRRRFQKS
jgi:Protein of unknown function (DUF642)/PEP-CTERM motif